ncbi:hypothetical protein [Marinactinospora rubrisoli]|uniref:Uncharacterized protein n=1 Tax=Marinactinospora rubrisoli TaxID=2715399 RepID=A0ABW2KNN0_9ACTN
MARSRYEKRRRVLIGTGRWQPWGDLDEVRAHLRRLQAAGVGAHRVAEEAGIAHATVFHLLNHAGAVSAEVARRLLAVELDPLPDAKVCADGTRRRLQALGALGYSAAALEEEHGLPRSVTARVTSSARLVAARTAARVTDIYAELSSRPAPESRSASRTRGWARKQGWLPPAAHEEDLLDLPEEEYWAAVEHRASLMSDTEAIRCRRALAEGDRSPLIVAGAREWRRRHRARRRAADEAVAA